MYMKVCKKDLYENDSDELWDRLHEFEHTWPNWRDWFHPKSASKKWHGTRCLTALQRLRRSLYPDECGIFFVLLLLATTTINAITTATIATTKY